MHLKVFIVKLYCLLHALSNTLVEADKGMDEVVRELMPEFVIGKEKTKAFVETHKSPGNKMVLDFCKLFAPCSNKDWTKSFDFQGWELLKYNTHSTRDLKAILGSRFGIFFTNPKTILRAWDHAKEYLAEKQLVEITEGKLRFAQLSALSNDLMKANMISKTLIGELIYWPVMKRMNAQEAGGARVHVFDLAPPIQQAGQSILRYAEDPTRVLEGRGMLFDDEPAPEPDDDIRQINEELREDDVLRANVTKLVRAGLAHAHSKWLKHTAEYQEGGVAAKNNPHHRAAAVALHGTSSQQEGDFGMTQYLNGTKGKARHQKLRSAVGHGKMRRNCGQLEALQQMPAEERRRYFNVGRLARARRIQREGHTRNDIAKKHAAELQEYREGQLTDARAKEEERQATRRRLEAVPRCVTMQELHHLNTATGENNLKLQLELRKILDGRRIDGKAMTIGGSRVTMLERLQAVLLLENPHAADGYDIKASKSAYLNGTASMEAGEPLAEPVAEPVVEPPPPPEGGSPSKRKPDDVEPPGVVERIELAEERCGQMQYLIKWRGKGVEENSWLTDIKLQALGVEALELLATFEEAQVLAATPPLPAALTASAPLTGDSISPPDSVHLV